MSTDKTILKPVPVLKRTVDGELLVIVPAGKNKTDVHIYTRKLSYAGCTTCTNDRLAAFLQAMYEVTL